MYHIYSSFFGKMSLTSTAEYKAYHMIQNYFNDNIKSKQ